MVASEERLIRLLRERNADREKATGGGLHPAEPIPPATNKEVRAAERAIGWELPELLREIYLKVANGGLGPEYGIVGMVTGFKLDGCSLESCYQEMREHEQQNPVWRWPEGLLPVANYGCGMWSCVDCTYKRLPMFLWDPNNLDPDVEDAEARLNWGNAFWDQGVSLKKWLEDWLAEEDPPEPKWPSDAWMKKRLGFILS